MSTLKNDDNIRASSISSEAYELLHSFVGGFDEVVYDIAEEMARQRDPQSAASGKIDIEVQDIKAAAAVVTNALRLQLKSGKLPLELSEVIEDMTVSFETLSNQKG